ncbi:hypothetical protein C8F01DRAFT_1087959 [Mycena amicta]|nr:hypothetical protein C8F01DRAFT_1087959 [Mycena amicta]
MARSNNQPLSESTMAARRNPDEVREKQRIRMAERRAQRRADPALRKEDQARVKTNNRNYRQRHPDRLAQYEQKWRDIAYAQKHGENALMERWADRRRQDAEEEEAMRQTERREARRRRKMVLQQEVDAEADDSAQARPSHTA